jgi:hypothetical protein
MIVQPVYRWAVDWMTKVLAFDSLEGKEIFLLFTDPDQFWGPPSLLTSW